jgi:FkbM family methyltransferase
MPIWFRKYYRSLFYKISSVQYQHWKKRRMLRFYGKLIKPGNLCFDIGANRGIYSKAFKDLGATVIAIEPLSESYNKLIKDFKDYPNIKVLQVAVGAQSGEGKIYKGNFAELSSLDRSFIEFNEQQFQCKWRESEIVKLITLDELIAKHGLPSFCKIDVEGYEEEVLKGLSHTIPIISFEYLHHFKEKSLACLDIISHLSPKVVCNYSLFEFFDFENKDWIEIKTFKEHLKNLPASHATGDIFCKFL